MLLEKRGARVTYSDPFIPSIRLDQSTMESRDLLESATVADCVVIITDHSGFDYTALLQVSKLIVDTRNAMKHLKSDKIVRL